MQTQCNSHQATRPTRRSVHVACEVIRARDFRLVARRTLDLSLSGMLVVSERPVLTGEELIITLRVPLGSAQWFDAEAVVTRVIHGRRLADPEPALGIAFTWSDPIGARALETQLGWFAESRARARHPQ